MNEKITEALLAQWQLVRQAALPYVAGLVAVGVAMFAVFEWHYQSVVNEKMAIIERKQADIDGQKLHVEKLVSEKADLTRKVELLTQQLAKAPPLTSTTATRNPDGVYQLGARVGLVGKPIVDESQSKVVFARILDAKNLNVDKEFEYRDMVLRIVKRPDESRATAGGQMTRALHQVTCEIVRRIPPP